MSKNKHITVETNDLFEIPRTIEIISRDENGGWKKETRKLTITDPSF